MTVLNIFADAIVHKQTRRRPTRKTVRHNKIESLTRSRGRQKRGVLREKISNQPLMGGETYKMGTNGQKKGDKRLREVRGGKRRIEKREGKREGKGGGKRGREKGEGKGGGKKVREKVSL